MGRRRPSVERQGLKADSLRLWHLVAVGLAFRSLALVVYLNVGFIEQTAGQSRRWCSCWLRWPRSRPRSALP